MIRRFRTGREGPNDGQPYVFDWRMYDIGDQVAGAIECAPPGLLAVSVRWQGNQRFARRVERAARKRNARVIWLHVDPRAHYTKGRIK